MVKTHRDGATWLPVFASTHDVRCTVRIVETSVPLSHAASRLTYVALSHGFITN